MVRTQPRLHPFSFKVFGYIYDIILGFHYYALFTVAAPLLLIFDLVDFIHACGFFLFKGFHVNLYVIIFSDFLVAYSFLIS